MAPKMTLKQKTFVGVREQELASLVADLVGAQFRAALAEALAEDRAARTIPASQPTPARTPPTFPYSE